MNEFFTDPNDRKPHRFKNIQYPATAGFLYYSILSVFTGYAEPTTEGFLISLGISAFVSAIVYATYRYFVCRSGEDMQKMWAMFAVGFVAVTPGQLGVIWQFLVDRAAA